MRGDQPLSLWVHRQGQGLQGVGPRQRRGLVLSENHDGDDAIAVYVPHAPILPDLDRPIHECTH